MLLRLAPLPHGESWSFEPKWDGFRALAVVDARTRLLSRRGSDLTRLCPAISSLGADLSETVLDGELVAFRDGQPSFEALQAVMRRGDTASVAFLAFDLLWLRGTSLFQEPYQHRREALEALMLPDPAYVSPRFDDGETLFAQTRDQGYEGVVAKRRTSVYRCGERSDAWIKAKHWHEGEFVIGGWSPPYRDHGWGLLVGEADEEGDLRFRGRVEWGITLTDREELEGTLAPLSSHISPFVDHRERVDDVYVSPSVSVEIRYLEVTTSGVLRHATFRQIGGRW